MQKTIGGDRLGAGGKMQTELHNYERSNHDIGKIWRSTMAPGTLVPFMLQIATPGTTLDVKLQADVKTNPTLGPLFGSFKLQLDVFKIPMRLYLPALMQNTTAVGNNMKNILLPSYGPTTLTASSKTGDYNTQQINPSSIMAYLGVRGWGYVETGTPAPRLFNAIPYIAYWDIYKNYYANKQELIGAYLLPPAGSPQTISGITINGLTLSHPGVGTGITIGPGDVVVITYSGAAPTLSQILVTDLASGQQIPIDQICNFGTPTGTTITSTSNIRYIIATRWDYAAISNVVQVNTFPLTNIDDMKTAIITKPPLSTRHTISQSATAPYGPPLSLSNSIASQCGLGLKTYQSDLFNNWMQTTWQTAITTATNISTAGGFFSIDSLILSRKLYDLLNRIAISGGSYEDWINAAYTHEPISRCTAPVYEGGLSKEVVFEQVVSNSASPQAGQPLGTLAGRGAMAHKHKGGTLHIRVDEPSYIMGIVSLTPRIDYSQGNSWLNNILTMDDIHKPGLDGIGFQDLITEQMAWWDTHWNGTQWVTNSAGKQPAWINYMTDVNTTHGNFAQMNNLMFMTLNRRYNIDTVTGKIQDLTTYIDPTHYNFVFAETSADAQNFWVQIAMDVTRRAKMSSKIMPQL